MTSPTGRMSAPLLLGRRPVVRTNAQAAEVTAAPLAFTQTRLPRWQERVLKKPARVLTKAVLEARNKERRAASRRAKHGHERVPVSASQRSFLEVNTVTPVTTSDYHRRFGAFLAWAATAGMPVQTVKELELAILVWFEERFFEGDDSAEAGKLLASAVYCRMVLRGSSAAMPRAVSAAKGWRRLAPLWSRLPLPWEVTALIADWMIRHRRASSALRTVLTFALYLRPAEAMRIRVGDVVPPMMHRGSAHRFWCLVPHPQELETQSKTGEFESLILNSPHFFFLNPLLEMLTRHRRPDEPLLTGTYFEWANDFQEAGLDLPLTALGPPVLYQLRHGGASFELLMAVRELIEIKKRGRWKADASLRRYEKGGRVQQQLQQLGPELLARATAAGGTIATSLCKAFGVRRRGPGARLC